MDYIDARLLVGIYPVLLKWNIHLLNQDIHN
jgi:hypothetical protein